MKYILIFYVFLMAGCSTLEDDLIITEKRLNTNSIFNQKYKYVINHNVSWFSNKEFNVGDTLK